MRKAKKSKKNEQRVSNRAIICSKDTEIECPLCGTVYTAEEWDKATYDKCTTRVLRRDFKSITTAVSRRSGEQRKKYYYWCDGCKSVISGDKFGKVT